MRIVGNQNRSEFELDPVKAWHRGRQLDALLATALPERPRGVWRAQHSELNRLDDEWQLAIARQLNEILMRTPDAFGQFGPIGLRPASSATRPAVTALQAVAAAKRPCTAPEKGNLEPTGPEG